MLPALQLFFAFRCLPDNLDGCGGGTYFSLLLCPCCLTSFLLQNLRAKKKVIKKKRMEDSQKQLNEKSQV